MEGKNMEKKTEHGNDIETTIEKDTFEYVLKIV